MSAESVITVVAAAIGSPLCLKFFDWLLTRNGARTAKLIGLKCAITNKEYSKQARLDAYDEYKKLGGDGWIDDYVEKHVKPLSGDAA